MEEPHESGKGNKPVLKLLPNKKIPTVYRIKANIVIRLPPCLSANLPAIGVNIPQTIACIAIARPNSVVEIPQSISKLFENNPKVCLRPIVAKTIKHAETKVIKAILFGKKYFIILFFLMLVLDL